MSTASHDDQLDRIRTALRGNVASLAHDLLGEHNRAASTRLEHRWGRHGSLRVTVAGADQGACADFETGWSGGPFSLVMRERRIGFAEAVEWASNWTGISINGYRQPDREPEPPRQQSEREIERERKRAEQEAEEAAKREKGIAAARAFWASRLPTPIDTVAEHYVVLRRGIPLRPSAWPECAGALPPDIHRWSEIGANGGLVWKSKPYAGGLIVAATTPDGTLTAVQRIFLDQDADNLRLVEDGAKLKLSRGLLTGVAARLPGPPDGPLLLAEGPETGLSLWVATGHETWIALGSIALHHPPAGRRIVVCRDDDMAHSPADKALTRAVRKWRVAGIDVTVATPWGRVRRNDKSDFNDVIRDGGVAAIRARINEALVPPAIPVIKRLPVSDARPLMKSAIAKSFTVARHTIAAGLPPPVHAIKIDLGAGKSDTARREAVQALIQQRAAGDTRAIAIALPTHALGAEFAAAIEAIPAAREAGITAGIWRGRRADDPAYPGRTMCMDLDRVDDAMDASADVEKACCKSRHGQCPFFTHCGYQAQKILCDRIPAVWLLAHENLFHPAPATVGEISHLIVDERMWDSGLIGHTGPHRTLSLDTLEACSLTGIDGQRLRFLRNLVLSVLRSAPDGPLIRKSLLDAGLTEAAAREAGILEWAQKIDSKIHPGMSVRDRKAAVRHAAINRTIRRLAMFWHAVAALLAKGGPELSGWAGMVDLDTKEGSVRAIVLKGRSEVHDDWKVPTLAMDATMDINLLRPYWPTIELTADISITAPHQHVLQVADKTYAKNNFDLTRNDLDDEKIEDRKDHLRELNASLGAIARTFAPGRTVVVTQLVVSDALPDYGCLPDTIDHAHHNAVAGIDAYRNHAALIAVGRTAPPPIAAERIAEALSGRAVPHLTGWYPKVATHREMADGSTVAAETDEHPDPIAEAIRWQCCEAELLQIIGRVRGVNRTEADPVTVIVMASTPLPLPITRLLTAQDLRPDPIDLQLALGGIAFTNPSHASRAYPELWNNPRAAESAFRKADTSGGFA